MFWLSLLLFVFSIYCLFSTVLTLRKYKKKYGEHLERFLNGYDEFGDFGNTTNRNN